jgi:hypothetical protein
MNKYGVSRVTIKMIPATLTKCPLHGCVYNSKLGFCDNPRINKGNSDAACHRKTNRDLLMLLDKGDHCPNCPDQGWYIVADNSGEPEQVQCEWCYTVPNSVFNQTLDKGD